MPCSRTAKTASERAGPAARLALGSPVPVTIVPCGLTFIHPKRFRSRVLVQYGAPLAPKGDPREVTAAIQQGLVVIRALGILAQAVGQGGLIRHDGAPVRASPARIALRTPEPTARPQPGARPQATNGPLR